MHRSQRTGAVTCRTRRWSTSRPWLTAAPSRLDSRIRCGSAGVIPAATAARAVSAGAMYGVWNAPATCSVMTRVLAGGSAASFASPSSGAGGDDLAGAVAVGRVQPVRLDGGEDLVGVAAEDGGHAGRFERAGGGHLPAAYAGEGDRGLGGQHPGERGGGELADAVPGGQRDVVHRQVLGGEQGGGDQQRLGPGGVLDLVRVGLGAEVHQVDAGRARTTSAGGPRRRGGRARG